MNTDRHADISDNELLQRYLQGRDSSWLGILLQRYTLLLLGVCMKYLKDENEAQDAVQQVFLKTIQEVHKYKIDYFKSWLYMVARNHCLTLLRDRKAKRPHEFSDEYAAEYPAALSAEKPLKDRVTPEALNEAMNELNEEQRQCLNLFYLEKMSYAEVGERTGFNAMQVKSYIQNGKRNLRLIIEKKIQQTGPEHG